MGQLRRWTPTQRWSMKTITQSLQTALAAMEEETNVVQLQLVVSNAKVVGRLFNLISY
jgi:hypothetical protein